MHLTALLNTSVLSWSMVCKAAWKVAGLQAEHSETFLTHRGLIQFNFTHTVLDCNLMITALQDKRRKG